MNNNEGVSQYDPAKKKAEHREDFERQKGILGNLSDAEIKEFGDFEFEQGPDTVSKQIRRYYLMIKSNNPKFAESMLSEVGDISDEDMEESDIHKLCTTLSKYVDGVIHYKGKTYIHSIRRGIYTV